MNSALRLLRPVNAVMAVLGTFISSLVTVGYEMVDHIVLISMASLVVFLVLTGGNVMNDVLDAENDKINHPERPIPSGKITKNQGTYVYTTSYILSIIIAFVFLNIYAVIVVIFADLLLIVYETRGKYKGLSGNIIISILIGAIFLFGGIVFLKPERTLLLMALASLSNLSRELIKDVQDMEGDVDRITFPKKYGAKTALNLSSALIIVTIIVSFVPYLAGLFSYQYLIAVIICDLCFVSTMITQYRSAEKGQNLSKLSMILGLVSFTVGGIF
jgi:geranylgeranylglycerol-phosphate geranylgeranyltransferase